MSSPEKAHCMFRGFHWKQDDTTTEMDIKFSTGSRICIIVAV